MGVFLDRQLQGWARRWLSGRSRGERACDRPRRIPESEELGAIHAQILRSLEELTEAGKDQDPEAIAESLSFEGFIARIATPSADPDALRARRIRKAAAYATLAADPRMSPPAARFFAAEALVMLSGMK